MNLKKIFKTFSEQDKQIIKLSALGYSPKDIVDILKLPISVTHRALKRISKALEISYNKSYDRKMIIAERYHEYLDLVRTRYYN